VRYAQLGTGGPEISRIVLGAGNFGGVGSAPEFFGAGESEPDAFAIMDAAWELGITCFDTADAYGGGRSETMIGNWFRSKGREVREQIVLATKVFNPMAAGADYGLSRERIVRQLESSLERLGVEHVELYLTHQPDPDVPLEETLGALEELKAADKIGHPGASNVSGAVLREALALGSTYEWVQDEYSLLNRADEDDVLPLCRAHGLGYQVFSPLAGGWLTGKYRQGEPLPAGSRMTMRPQPYEHLRSDRVFGALAELSRAAEQRGIDTVTLAYAWLLAQPDVTAIVVGPRTPAQLEPARAALEVSLSADEANELAAIFG
jgi:aryl-alcohol dehydrogenase-like predicted oxidoreductase